MIAHAFQQGFHVILKLVTSYGRQMRFDLLLSNVFSILNAHSALHNRVFVNAIV